MLSFLCSGHDETVKILIERGADVDSKTIIGGSSPRSEVKEDEWTPLHKAAYRGNS